MNDRIGRPNQFLVFIVVEAEARFGQISLENPYAGIQKSFELSEVDVQLQGSPQANVRLALIARPHQKIQRIAVIPQQVRRDVRADITGGTGQKNGHVFGLGRPCRCRFRLV